MTSASWTGPWSPAADATVQQRRDAEPVLLASGLVRSFGEKVALNGVSLELRPGEVRALVGPNGAGKTTLLRVLSGLLDADRGSLRMLGLDGTRSARELRRRVGVVPSGTRSFYLRISGLENLVFFARLYGLGRRDARRRAIAVLGAVDLADVARQRVSTYSTGMQRRLAVARALLHEPALLLVDEATHDLDPEQSSRVRALAAGAAAGGTAVLWATQRLEELKGFARTVTLVDRGNVRFEGTLPQLLAIAGRRRYLLALDAGDGGPAEVPRRLGELATLAEIDAEAPGHYLLALADGAVLGDALERLWGTGLRVLECTEAHPSVEEAFLSLLGRDA